MALNNKMSLLILQIVIKQWDKSQRTDTHILQRATIPDKYPVLFPPAFYAFNKQCIIDQHGDDIQGNRVKYAQGADGNIYFDRFRVSKDNIVIAYHNAKLDKPPHIIGSLDKQWIQCKYSILDADMYYWLYEEVTVNAIVLSKFDEKVFLNAEPQIVYEDFNELDNARRS
ncbi:conserved hypothetical protein [Bathymodiolus platifrons methanotrophic gill symbiont]|nr:hypothetical protein BMR02_06675 [Methylococcaceae bacterium HT1]TXL13601.1 hypothetical protein BMR05_10740 [Methylococcaceae bacterium HT4]TXL16909.1 hypothetical protein BMR04_08050 [Methylococcaceae bacterium HT3]TXL19169.1 hypothetical protein BMR06_11160 [Methylococcaceae bacterium HT5]TXL22663.1 hypothetical protein BMR03_06890 [Methylococcaceae bacterium HT2]GAW86561.1 conserved hypothetical protein [Bathymodiolus platifrons methanotrophic gill symbiont]